MFSAKTQLLTFTFFLMLTMYFLTKTSYIAAAACAAGLILTVIVYFKFGTVLFAYKYFVVQNLPAVDAILSNVKYPKFLAKSQKGLYYFMSAGVKLFHHADYSGVETELTEALKYNLRSESNISVAYIMFAQMYLETEDLKKAEEYIGKAKSNPHSEVLDEGILNIENEIMQLKKKKK